MASILQWIIRIGSHVVTALGVGYSVVDKSRQIGSTILLAFLIALGVKYADKWGEAIASFVMPTNIASGAPWADGFAMLNWVFPVTEILGWLPIAISLYVVTRLVRIFKSLIPGVN